MIFEYGCFKLQCNFHFLLGELHSVYEPIQPLQEVGFSELWIELRTLAIHPNHTLSE